MDQSITIHNLRKFLQDGGDADVRLAHNQPLLTRAVLTGEIELVQILLDAGAAVNPVWERPKIVHPDLVQRDIQDNIESVVEILSEPIASIGERMAYDIDTLFQDLGDNDDDYDREYDWIDEVESPEKIQSPLVAAVAIGDHQMVELLLRSSAQPNLANYAELWPIVIAAHKGDYEIVQTLLEAGADPSTQHCRPTALGVASYKGHLEIVRLLLKYQADPNIPTHEDGYTPLMRAATDGHLEIVKMLVAAGADVNVWTECDNALECAIFYAERDIYEFLLPYATEETRRLLGSDIAHRFQRAEVQKQRLENRAARKLVDLAFAGKVDQLKLLIATGIDVNGLNPGGDTALIAAARFGHVQVMQALLAAGADPNFPDEDYDGAIGYSPIMNAITDRHSDQCVECINLLLAAGADVNQTTAEGVTALMMAALIGPNLPALRRLLEAGADVHRRNHEGKTALDIALAESEQMSGFDEAIALLRAAESSQGKL
jgi:ankyrin repeat protein